MKQGAAVYKPPRDTEPAVWKAPFLDAASASTNEDRRLRIPERHADRRASGARWLGRLALFSAVRFGRVLRGVARRSEKRAMGIHPEGRDYRDATPLSRRHADSRNGNRNSERRDSPDRFHAAARRE